MNKFEVFDSDGNLVGEYHNAFVVTGRMFAMAALWGVQGDQWAVDSSGTPIDTWDRPSAPRPRYVALGTSSVANGIQGPGELGPIARDGPWQGASEKDYYLPGEVGIRKEVTVNIVDGLTYQITFTYNGAEAGNAPDVRTFGFFLTDESGTPVGDPTNDAQYRRQAMIARIITYNIDETNNTYIDQSYDFTNNGTSYTFRYTFKDV